MLDIEKWKVTLQKFADERDWNQFHNPKNLAMALSVEASELLEEFQWLTAEEAAAVKSDPEKLVQVGSEIADVAMYLIRLVDKLGIDLEAAIAVKHADNQKKYPVELVKGSSKKYDQY